MTRLEINKDAFAYNCRTIRSWMEYRDVDWFAVVKALSGHSQSIQLMMEAGIRHFAGSRLENLETIQQMNTDCHVWYLRPPSISEVSRMVSCCDGSLNSEIETLFLINQEARKISKRHKIILMIELGDLREGILPENLVKFYESVSQLDYLEIMGIGSNIGCLHGSLPTREQYSQLALCRELIELKFKTKLKWVSAGTSVALPWLKEGTLPSEINHFRVGESLFLGNSLLNGKRLQPLRGDVFELHAEIVEYSEKSLSPTVGGGEINPFPTIPLEEIRPGARGRRALISIGRLDCDVTGLAPLDTGHQIAGATSDLTVVNISAEAKPLKLGEKMRFTPNYSALIGLMHSRYVIREMVSDFVKRKRNRGGIFTNLILTAKNFIKGFSS
jgi:predicted amino acid racemase